LINNRLASIALIALTVLFTIQLPVHAAPSATKPAATQKGAKKNNRINGKVTAVDTSAGTITILDKKTNTTSVVTIDGKTKFAKTKEVAFSTFAIGDHVAIGGKGITPGATSVTAGRITLESPLADETKNGKNKGNKRGVQGTIVTLAPLSITTDDGTTVSVTTDATTRYFAQAPATFTDVVVGDHVQVNAKTKGASLVAGEVTIAPAKAGHGKKKSDG